MAVCSYEDKEGTKCYIGLIEDDFKKGFKTCRLHRIFEIKNNKDENFENDENYNKKIEEIKKGIEKIDEIINGKEIEEDNPFCIYEKNKMSRFINNNDIIFIKEDANFEFLHKEMLELEKNNNTEDYQDYLEDKDYYYENYKVDMDEINDIINEAALVNDVGYDKLAISGVLHAATLIFKKFDLDYEYITYKDENNKFYIYHKNDYSKVDIVNELNITENIIPLSNSYVNESDDNKNYKINPLNSNDLNKLEASVKLVKEKFELDKRKTELFCLKKDYLKKKLTFKTKQKKIKNLLEEFKSTKLHFKEHIFDEIDSILNEINENYEVINCKHKGCNNQCYNDIGYCSQHYDICSECDKVLKKEKGEFLTNNKKFNIENCCPQCSYKKYFDYFVKNYKIEDIIHHFDENDKLYNTKKIVAKKNYLDMERDVIILDEIKNREDLLEKEILELYDYTFEEDNKYKQYNDFTKYKLFNRVTSSKELLTDFGLKLENIKIKPSFYTYMGKLEYAAFKDFLKGLLELDNINKTENDFDDILDLEYFSDNDKPPEKSNVTRLVFT